MLDVRQIAKDNDELLGKAEIKKRKEKGGKKGNTGGERQRASIT